ncbi:glutathione S-transferase family protein [Chitinilyticum litopenaei]|uniref:glutathione S-transferase family protein n=1 Tax=Chitinilyticum litopenaei TaxID=1121276 RepID=UPI0004206EA5|nr:glutathione S-transferase N-terminal domain-containing protein [Chitinilyticum litopenaei]
MYQLYYYPSNASLAPHMLLEEIGAPFELRLVDRAQNAHKHADYLKLNPTGRIPALLDGELTLFESAAICLHLAERHEQAQLLPPAGSAERAHCYKWLMYLTNTLQAEILTYFYPERLCDDAAATAQVKAHAEARIGDMLALLDAELADGRTWLLGEQYRLVDPYLGMLCRWTRGFTRPARSFVHLGPYLQRLLTRPAVVRALRSEGLPEPWV